MQKVINSIIKELSIKYKLPEEVIESIVNTPYRVANDVIADIRFNEDNKEVPIVRVLGLGFFKMNVKRLYRIKDYNWRDNGADGKKKSNK